MNMSEMAKTSANYVPLTPLSFLARTAAVYPRRISAIDGDREFTWVQTYERCRRFAAALASKGVKRNDVVALMAPNILAAFEAHFAVPMAGAVLNALNVRLDSETIAFALAHGEARVLITDVEFSATIAKALERLPVDKRPLVIDICDGRANGTRLGTVEYEDFVASGSAGYEWGLPPDEWDSIALNYTSGTTGNPKGVVYHHRGAYLNAIGNILSWGMPLHPVYLWTLPMFHCNGWCFPWTITALAGTHVCLRRVDAQAVFALIKEHRVTHMCGAPIVMSMLLNASRQTGTTFTDCSVNIMTAGAAPPAAMIEGIEGAGFNVTHVYGLTEVYGPVTVCAWQDEWDTLPLQEKSRLKARQGVRYSVLEGLMVGDANSLAPVPVDGLTMGEVLMRGNVVMKGYLKNEKATAEALAGGWFHTGDLAVVHPDGYVEIKDRSKDIIISGGENISTIEVEGVLYRHPAVLEAAVVARPDEQWGETPCAFVALKPGVDSTADEIIAFCRDNMAHYKAPRFVVFGELPKTSTGKTQKYVLRERAKALEAGTRPTTPPSRLG
jgi:fatty-acyl-CoA synthase